MGGPVPRGEAPAPLRRLLERGGVGGNARGDRHLQRHRVDALTHLGPAVAHLDLAVATEVHDGPSDLLEAVAETTVLEPEPDTDGPACGHRLVMGRLDRVEALLRAESWWRPPALSHPWSRALGRFSARRAQR